MEQGRSPRTRGSPRGKVAEYNRERSIPAHAGEPFAQLLAVLGDQVDPRARGGAICPTLLGR